jgi:hypothetical protein
LKRIAQTFFMGGRGGNAALHRFANGANCRSGHVK